MSRDTVECCPDCRGTRFKRRVRFEWLDTDDNYHCEDCGTTFDDPDTRPTRNHSTPGAGSSLGATLAEMEPDDLPAGGDA